MPVANVFDFVDYQKPIGNKNDYRTSSYIGHHHMVASYVPKATVPAEKKQYGKDPALEQRRFISDYKENYDVKFGDPNELRNPTIPGGGLYVKPFVEQKLKFIERPMRPPSSTSHQDYQWITPVTLGLPKLPDMPAVVANTPIMIDRAKPGHSKLLDPSATTQRLSFVRYTTEQLEGIAAHDNITYWSWPKFHIPKTRVFTDKDAQMCDDLPADQCLKRNEFCSMLKRVPHSGMTTEVRQNYRPPHEQSKVMDMSPIRHPIVHVPVTPSAKKTEYNVYGSGERTDQYV